MGEVLVEVKTGKIQGLSSDGTGVGYGVRRKWNRPQDKHKGEREAMLCVFGEIAKENRLVKMMSKPLEGDQVSMVPLHGEPEEKIGNSFWSLLHILCLCQKASKEESQSRITWRDDSVLLAIYKSVKDQIKEAMESRVEAEAEDSMELDV